MKCVSFCNCCITQGSNTFETTSMWYYWILCGWKEPFKSARQTNDFNASECESSLIWFRFYIVKFGIISKKNIDSYLKRLSYSSLFRVTHLCEVDFLHMLLTDWVKADMRISQSYVKPDIKDTCKIVKLWHSSKFFGN